jgi:hypothetical protein
MPASLSPGRKIKAIDIGRFDVDQWQWYAVFFALGASVLWIAYVVQETVLYRRRRRTSLTTPRSSI